MSFKLTVVFYNKDDKISFGKDEICKHVFALETSEKELDSYYGNKTYRYVCPVELGIKPVYYPGNFYFNGNFDNCTMS